MNTQLLSFDPEDPRLTAYALGELPDPAERAAVEQILEQSPEARAALHEIRALTAALGAEYEHERLLTSGENAAGPGNVIAMTPRSRTWPRRLLLAAAMLVLLASVARLMMPHYTMVPSGGQSVSKSVAQSSPAQRYAFDERVPIEPLPTPTAAVSGQSPVVVAQPPSTAPAFMGETAAAKPSEPRSAFETESTLKDQQLASVTTAAAAPPIGPLVTRDQSTTRLIQRKSDAVGSISALPPVSLRRPYSVAGSAPMVDAKKYGFAEDADDVGAVSPPPGVVSQRPEFNTAVYEHRAENPFLAAKDHPLSTFSIDVDTASYANVRRFIESGSLPPPDAVRVEEMINYFPYNYAPPAPGDERPFAVHLEAASCPWNPQDRLVRIGIKGRELARDKRPASNLVFLLDVSGSMEPPERLPLIKASMRLLVEQLTAEDRVAIVTYAGESGIALPSTAGDKKETILRVLDGLQAGGSTNGASGIKLAYRVARDGFINGGTNRVILATDGDFNVGVTSQGDLVRMIEREAKSGVALSALGVGTDNYKDATMQKLADKGNGNYHYIDRLDEARKVLVEQMSGTLVTIAKDVKIQVEFNPATVAAYRLIGYEKRMLRKEDFNDDRVDAGEIGAGHCVTALYEVVPAGLPVPQTPPAVDALKYGNALSPAVSAPPSTPGQPTGELLTVKMRHKTPDGDKSERAYEEALTDHDAPGDFANATPDFKFAAAVASFGMALRDSTHPDGATFGAALELAQQSAAPDPGEYRAGFIELVKKAQAIQRARGE